QVSENRRRFSGTRRVLAPLSVTKRGVGARAYWHNGGPHFALKALREGNNAAPSGPERANSVAQSRPHAVSVSAPGRRREGTGRVRRRVGGALQARESRDGERRG